MGRRLLKCILATALVLAFAVPVALANVGGFAGGDGTQVAGDCSTAIDWQCLSPSQFVSTLDPSGAGDVVFGGGEKEDSPDQWTFTPGSATAKSDTLGAWSYSFTNPTHDTNYLALAFNRGGTGDSFFGFELNQSATPMVNSAGTSVVCPATGDVIVSFEIPGSGSVALHVYKWSWTSGTPCMTGSTGSFTALSLPAGSAELAINQSSSISNFLSTDVLGTSLPTGTFGEAAVNLTAIANAVAPAAGCEFFNHVQVTSRSSSTITSQLQDFVDGGAVAARACESPGGGGGGGGGGGCTSFPSVQVSSPVDGYIDPTSSVTLSGTSDQTEVELLDGDTVVANAPVSAGTWTLTLNNVPDGSHAYSAVATDSNGCTAPSNTVHVTVHTTSGGGGSSGNGGGGGNGAGGSMTTSAGSMNPSGSAVGDTKGAGAGKHKKRKGAVCSSKRKFIIRIRTHHARLVSATITVNGKVVKTLRGKRITAPVDLRGLPRGGFTVRIRAVAANGRVFTGKRVYHTCTARKNKRTIPLL